MVHGLEAKYSGKIKFFFLDADDPATLNFQKEFGFQYQPFFVLMDGKGNEVKRWAGFVSSVDFETAFVDLLR